MRIRTLAVLLLFALFSLPSEARLNKVSETPVALNETKDQLLSENDRSVFDYYFQEALSLRHQGKYDAAFDMFRYCVSLDSLNAQAWYEIAVFYNNLKQPDNGLKAMQKAYAIDPTNEWYTFGLANTYISLQKLPDAIALYEKLVKNKPEDENLQFQLAGLYTQTQDYQGAIRKYDQVERLIGKNESVSFEKYKLYKDMGKPKKAIREISSLCAEYPYDVEYVLLLGDAWMDLGDFDKALAQYETARKMNPENPSVALSMADYYNEIGDTLSARKQMSLALTNPNTDVDTKLSIFASILSASQTTADSLQIPGYFEILLEQHPNEYKIRDLHVQWLLSKGKKQEAKDELRTVLDLNPNQLQAWKNYLELNAEADNYKEIRKICNDALTYFPKEPLFMFYLGLSWITVGDGLSQDAEMHQKAIQAFKEAIAVSKPEDLAFISRLYGLIGDSYLVIKDKQAAYESYDKALEVHPGNVLVLNNYAYYLSEEGGDLPKAERMSRKTIEVEPKNATYLDTYAWIFFREGKYGLAKIYIERAVTNVQDSNSVILEHYGDILWFNGEHDAARVQWEKALSLQDPSEILLQKVKTGVYVKTIKQTP